MLLTGKDINSLFGNIRVQHRKTVWRCLQAVNGQGMFHFMFKCMHYLIEVFFGFEIKIVYYIIYNNFQVMRIEDTPIRDISDGTFDGSFAESLEELYIINTWLTRVSPAIKVSLSHYNFRVKLEK
jgi:hypothetical protein